MKKIIIWCSAVFLLLAALGTAVFFLLTKDEEKDGYRLYYLSQEEDQLVYRLHSAEESDPTALAAELYLQQQNLPEKNKENLKLLLPENVALQNFSVENDQILLDFSAEYTRMSREREILVRAGMVRLFTQIPGVRRILIQSSGEPIRNAEGLEIGAMTAGRFVESSGKDINSYLKTNMKLYFTDQEGKQLIPEERTVYYNSNAPLEKVVVEQLVKGPKEEGHAAVLPSEINILSVTIQEGICYVNLDNSFKNLLQTSNSTLNPELAVYSIVNSLADTCRVNKIQISVNGKTNLTVGSVDLSSLLNKREELIRTDEQKEESNS